VVLIKPLPHPTALKVPSFKEHQSVEYSKQSWIINQVLWFFKIARLSLHVMESRKCLIVESGILEFFPLGIQNTVCGIQTSQGEVQNPILSWISLQ